MNPSKPIMTLGDLLDSTLVGLWDDDDDQRSSAEIARDLRTGSRSAEHIERDAEELTVRVERAKEALRGGDEHIARFLAE